VKSFFSLILALVLLLFFGGTAWFYWESSSSLRLSEKGATTNPFDKPQP